MSRKDGEGSVSCGGGEAMWPWRAIAALSRRNALSMSIIASRRSDSALSTRAVTERSVCMISWVVFEF